MKDLLKHQNLNSHKRKSSKRVVERMRVGRMRINPLDVKRLWCYFFVLFATYNFSPLTAQNLPTAQELQNIQKQVLISSADTIILTDGSFTLDSAFRSLDGTWTGQGYQLDAHSFWDMQLICKRGRYLISYPSLACGGKWIVEEKKKNKLLFREQIKTGKDACYNNGFILIEPVIDGLLRFSIFYPNLNSLNAVGFLVRDNSGSVANYSSTANAVYFAIKNP